MKKVSSLKLRCTCRSQLHSLMQGDEAALFGMLDVGGEVLARTVDENRRSALHFSAALGKPALVQSLAGAGAEVDLADREGKWSWESEE